MTDWSRVGRLFVLLVHTVTLTLGVRRLSAGWDDERRLLSDLFEKRGYNPLIRPVNNFSETIEVEFGIDVQQLITVDERNQVMKTNLWLSMTWTDKHLLWNKEHYGGIGKIRVDYAKVWTPDIVLFNNADGKYEASYKSQVVVYNTGMLWVPPAIYKSTCVINVEYFPFDQQECELKFGSWTFNADELRLKFKNNNSFADISNYRPSQVWDIVDCPARIVTIPSSPPQEWMIYKFVIRRKSLFYTCNLILPCVLISILSIAVFFLPAHSCEKITLSISILFALVVFVLLVSKILPPAANAIPLIAKYLLFTFVCNIFSVVFSVLVINWNFRSPQTHEMPEWIKVIFLKFLSKILLMDRPDHKERYAKARKRNKLDTSECNTNCSNSNKLRQRNKSSDKRLWTPEIRTAMKSIDLISNHLRQGDESQAVKNDWVFVAAVFDRALLYIWLLVTITGTIGTILQAPHVFESINQEEIKQKIVAKMGGTNN